MGIHQAKVVIWLFIWAAPRPSLAKALLPARLKNFCRAAKPSYTMPGSGSSPPSSGLLASIPAARKNVFSFFCNMDGPWSVRTTVPKILFLRIKNQFIIKRKFCYLFSLIGIIQHIFDKIVQMLILVCFSYNPIK